MGQHYKANKSDSLASSTQSTAVSLDKGPFLVQLSGTWTGTAELQMSLDAGSTYVAMAKNADGDDAEYTANTIVECDCPVAGALFRVDFTRSSGTLVTRVVQG